MKERPIPYSAPMVLARMEGRKTQTRRLVKIQPPDSRYKLCTCIDTTGNRSNINRHHWAIVDGINITESDDRYFSSPYGYAGDRLWIREAWRIGSWDENTERIAIDYRADGFARKEWLDVPLDERDLFNRYWMQSADDAIKAGLITNSEDKYNWEPGQSPCRWRPPMFMPRFASRGLDEIVSVRVERLQDISEADAIAEGLRKFPFEDDVAYAWKAGDDCGHATATGAYRNLWESINGPGSWDLNPWVWVIEFKVIQL